MDDEGISISLNRVNLNSNSFDTSTESGKVGKQNRIAKSRKFNNLQDERLIPLNTCVNNSRGCEPRRNCPGDRCGVPPQGTGQVRRNGQRPAKAARSRQMVELDARALMNCCTQNTVEQAKQMHIKGTDCQQETPYLALRGATFRKLLDSNQRRPRKKRRPVKKIKWCRPKVDECESMQLQLCPHLGEGHTHEKMIQEMTPLLMRTAQSLQCQLREICRRLFFMQHNMPQMTAPGLVNFHAILSEITRMLITDFDSFPTGLKLPNCKDGLTVE